MRRSRLELYVDIICSLSQRALTVDEIALQCITNCVTLQEKLDFLVEHDVISFEVSNDNRTFYMLTRRGVSIFKTFSIAKHLEKLQGPPQTKEARKVVSELDQQEDASGVWRNQNR
jgi:predicted transcriptional regulator